MSQYTHISYRDAKKLLNGPTPHALLDVREAGEYAASHVLVAANAPASWLEITAPDLVPNHNVPIVLMDDGDNDDRAARAARTLAGMGYMNLMVLQGGVRLWEESGGTLVSGIFCLTKGFAEVMENMRNTPLVSPEDLMTRLADGGNITVIDVRAPEEFQALTLERAVNAPGCEAVYCLADIAPDPKTTVVITCAARARGIIWAQTLIDSGAPNHVFALLGGTMNWKKTGGTLLAGTAPTSGPPSDTALKASARGVEALKRRFKLPAISIDELMEWQAQASDFPLYVYDVRTKLEFETRHLKGSRNAPDGDIILRIEQYAAVRRAHMVLVDDNEARAVATASILLQMGVDNISILKGGLAGVPIEQQTSGPLPSPFVNGGSVPISAGELAEALENDLPPLVIDVGSSRRHQTEHIPSSIWVPRVYINRIRDARPDERNIVLISDDETHARLAAKDAMALWPDALVRYLQGGQRAWDAAGLPLEKGLDSAYCPPIDAPAPLGGDSPEAKAKAMEAYFDWNNTLADKIHKDGNMPFKWP